MKYKTTLLIVAANLAFILLLVIAVPHLMITPGNTIQAHAAFSTDCFACHTPFIGSQPEKCVACHKVSEIGLVTTKGIPISKEKKKIAFHQTLVEEDCVACHSEHKGVMAFRPISRFSHDLLEPALREQCDSCHANPGDALHAKIKGNCAQCHRLAGWTPATFEHNEFFRFDRHHDTQCETCHMDNDYSNYTCYGCHEHSRSKIREEHQEEGIYDYENCVECHRSGDEDEAERVWRSKHNKERFERGESSRYWDPYGRHRERDDD